jgi:hypothetical protein
LRFSSFATPNDKWVSIWTADLQGEEEEEECPAVDNNISAIN